MTGDDLDYLDEPAGAGKHGGKHGGQYGEGWRLRTRPVWLRLAVTAAGVLLVAAAVPLRPTTLGLALLVAALGVGLALLAWLEPGRHRVTPRTVERDGRTGLLVPLRTLPVVAVVALGVVAAAFVVLGVVLVARAVREADLWEALLGLAPLAIGAVVASVPVTAMRNRARVPAPGLLLTSEGLELPGPGLPVVRWDQVIATEARWVARPPGRASGSTATSNLLTLRLTPEAAAAHVADPYVGDTGAFHLSVESLASDPYAVHGLLDHYLATPADRAELGTNAAVRRYTDLASERTRP